MSGHYRMHRGWMEHPVFGREKFSRAQAWCWLIEHAAWGDTTQAIGRHRVRVQRGQLAAAVRYLAEMWDWSKSAVGRFLKTLEAGTMIGTDSGTHYTIITICNYDKYQSSAEDPGTLCGTDSGTRPRHRRDKEERREEENKDSDDGPRVCTREAAAQTIAAHFLAERLRLWPGTPHFPSDRATLITQAKSFLDQAKLVLDQGSAVQTITATITATAAKLHARGDPNPPTNLRFCERSLASRLANARPFDGASHDGPRPHDRPPRRSAPPSPHEALFTAGLAVAAECLENAGRRR